MLTPKSTIDNMPVLGKWEGRVNNFLYDKGLMRINLAGIPFPRILPIFNHGDGTATIFLEDYPQGFYAVVNNAMDSAYQCVLLGLLPRFVWGKCSLYFDPHMGTNVWEYFFKQPSSLPSLHCCIPFSNLRLSPPLCSREDFQNNLPYTALVKHFYTDLMLPEITEQIQDICLDGCIGVHFRSNYHDKFKHGDCTLYESYEKMIQQALERPEVTSDKIFVATDSELAVNKFKEMFPGLIITSSSARYKTDNGFLSDDEISGYQRGVEVIRDVERLSRCALFIHSGISNINLFLKYLHPSQPQINIYKYLKSNLK